MSARFKFYFFTWMLYFLQVAFAGSGVYAWVKIHSTGGYINLFLIVFFFTMSFIFYNLGVMYRREFGAKLERAFDSKLHDKLNRRGRRRLKKLNKIK